MNKIKEERKRIKRLFEVWSKEVKDRDKSCVICGEIKRLNAHHIIPRTDKLMRFNIKNGISLCPKHHRFSYELSAHQNPLRFIIWMQWNRKEQLEYLEDYLTKGKL